MNTIACNTLTGAVSEYTGFGFQSLTPTHAGSANGLFALGGDTDAGLPIVANIRLPREGEGKLAKGATAQAAAE